jgi:hypothetical protein
VPTRSGRPAPRASARACGLAQTIWPHKAPSAQRAVCTASVPRGLAQRPITAGAPGRTLACAADAPAATVSIPANTVVIRAIAMIVSPTIIRS